MPDTISLMSDLDTTIALVEWLGQRVRRSGNVAYATCPMHTSNKADRKRSGSLKIYSDGAARCWGDCAAGANSWSGAKYMWLQHMYGPRALGGYTREERNAADDFFRQQSWNVAAGRGVTAPPPYEPDERTRWTIGRLFDWSHEQFMRGDNWGMQYARSRGFDERVFPYLGYVPRESSKCFDLFDRLDTVCGKGYAENILDAKLRTGFLSVDHTIRLRNRLIICIKDSSGLPAYYQGRWVPMAPDFAESANDTNYAKLLSAPGWSGTPTFLEGLSRTVHVTESPTDGLSLHMLGASVIISWGWGKIHLAERLIRELCGQGRPLVVWQDPDTAGVKFTDTVYEITSPWPFTLQKAAPFVDPNNWLQHDRPGLAHLVAAA